MFSVIRLARQKLHRDRAKAFGWRVVTRKSARYALELATAPWHLWLVNDVGRGVRTGGRPHIENFGYMRLGDHTYVRSIRIPVELCTGPAGRLVIGRETHIHDGSAIGASGSIDIGARVRIGPYAMIVDTDYNDTYHRNIRLAPQPVVIEDDVWIGAKACVMPGVRVGRGAIVGYGAVVTQDVPPNTVVAGVPAQVVKTLDTARHRATQEVSK